MKEIEIRSWCDGPHEDRVPAERERTIVVDDGTSVLLDLCLVCSNALTALVLAGAPVKAVKEGAVDSAVAHRTCLICGQVSASRGALGTHVRKMHQMGLVEMRRQAS